MKLVPSRPVRRLLAGLTPIALVVAALPLMAPTCGGFAPGVKTFSRGSIIIPMDVCYQCSGDQDSATDPPAATTAPYTCNITTTYSTPANPGNLGGRVCKVNPAIGKVDGGDVVKAYGLVYQLIRNGVAVYWVINPAKTHLDDYDLTVQYGGGAPVNLYNWTNGSTGIAPTLDPTIDYMGGVFVVDGTDFARANAVLQGQVDPACTTSCEFNRTRFGAVNLHVSNVAFQANVARTMAGGWSAGGAIPPKLALLDIGSMEEDGAGGGTNARNAELVIRGYLQKAGLDFANAGGTSAANMHGQIYDRLTMEDFVPATPGDWKTSKLYLNGYQILWVPHWAAPGSCSDYSSVTNCINTQYSDAQVSAAISTIGSFVTDLTLVGGRPAGKKDIFAECAGLGSFDGVPGDPSYSPSWILAAQNTSHFQTEITPGFSITTTQPSAPVFSPNFSSPLLQIGDFEFIPRSGAISTYKATDYKSSVVRLISESADPNKDIFTLVPASADHGTIVYMGGHSYSGTQGNFATAATRLVLNTLFNLGATCVATGTTCATGALGVCGVGTMQCDADGNQVCLATATATTEICNGLDDDCDGLVDENLAQGCYDGPTGTENIGLCHGGQQQCVRNADGTYGYGACVGEQLPSTEICDGADNNCNGVVDEGLTKSCYTGPSSTLDPLTGLPMGICAPGTQTCDAGAWGTCTGQTLPLARECTIDNNAGNMVDDNCNGLVDEGCGCSENDVQPCYSGPAGTMTNLPCKAGTQQCTGGTWGTCTGQVTPVAEVCGNGIDDNCNAVADASEPACNTCVPQDCYSGLASTLPVYPIAAGEVRVCRKGTRACTDGVYGACLGEILPSAEVCDGKDNNCDGVVDEGPPACGTGLVCTNGVCVSTVCGAEQRCQQGYECVGGTCLPVTDCCLVPLDVNGLCPGATGTCDAGVVCRMGSAGIGTCIDPCSSVVCGEGTFCAGGICTGGACYAEGCITGQVCVNGSCTSDPCTAVSCPSSTFCRDGDCVQACAYVSCLEGQICGEDGFCKPDPCAGVSCGAGSTCIDGQCATNGCNAVDCGADKICRMVRETTGWAATCIDNPCAAVVCPSGFCLPRDAVDCVSEPCVRAQCFAADNLDGRGTVPPEKTTEGCGCATGGPSPLAILLGLTLLPLARRRRQPRGAGPLALLLAAGLTTTLAGCPEKKTTGTDPAECVQACNVGDIVAPYIATISPASGLKGSPEPVTVALTGERFASGATLRVFPEGAVTVGTVTVVDDTHATATLDLSAAAQETYLLRLVNPDKVISNLGTFDSVFATPVLSSITPAAGTAPAVVTVTATGSNFTPASVCRIQAGAYVLTLPTALQTTTPAGTTLQCTLDTSKVPPGVLQLWVANEGGLVSTQKTFTVTGALDANAMSPPAVPAVCSNPPGCTQSAVHSVVTVYGAGFASGCTVKADASNPPTTARATSVVDPTRLQATIDVTGIDSTTIPFNLYVTVTCGTSVTTPLTLPVVAPSSTIQVDTLAPQSAYQGSSVSLALSGSLLPTDSVVQILPPSGPNAGVWQSLVSGGGGAVVTGTLDLATTPANWPAGDYEVRLYFPTESTYSVTFPFRVLSNVPTLWSYTASPAEQQQGTSVAVTVRGTTFFTGIKLRLLSPTGTRIAPTSDATTFTPPDTLTATFSLTGLDTGGYRLVAYNTSSGDSNPLTFTVAPGQPTLTSLTPSSASQSAANPIVVISLAGTNFAKPDASGIGGSMVFIRNTGLGILPMTVPSDRVTVVDFDTIQVSFDTREAIPSAATPAPCQYPYQVKIVNPGATLMESAEQNFCLLP